MAGPGGDGTGPSPARVDTLLGRAFGLADRGRPQPLPDIAEPALVFYIVLLILGEFHAGLGLYRLAVKWGWPRRRQAELLFEVITALVVFLGLGALFMFRRL